MTADFAFVLFPLAAFLYASVGHGGASGYLAVMALLSFSPLLLRSTSLSMNIVVASIAALMYLRHQKLQWRLLWPFLITSIPFSLLGGTIQLKGHWHTLLLGVVLLYAASRLLFNRIQSEQTDINHANTIAPKLVWMLPTGAAMGLLSGLTGVGGGIFLSPILLFTGLCTPKQAAPIAAVFIALNSIAGLIGVVSKGAIFAPQLPIWIVLVSVASFAASYIGSTFWQSKTLNCVLAVVLLIAAAKLLGVSF